MPAETSAGDSLRATRPSVAFPEPTAAIPPPDPMLGGTSMDVVFSDALNSVASACRTSIPSPVPTISREPDSTAPAAEQPKTAAAAKMQTVNARIFMIAQPARDAIRGSYAQSAKPIVSSSLPQGE